MDDNWQIQAEKEIRVGRDALQSGLHGRARVCARRAAGIAARAYLQTTNRSFAPGNNFSLLNVLSQDEHLPATIQKSAFNLCLRVNEQYELPAELDLLEEALNIIEYVSNRQREPRKEYRNEPGTG